MEYTNEIEVVNDRFLASVLWGNETSKYGTKYTFSTELEAQEWITNTTKSIQDNNGVLITQPIKHPVTGEVFSETENPDKFAVYKEAMELLDNPDITVEDRKQVQATLQSLLGA